MKGAWFLARMSAPGLFLVLLLGLHLGPAVLEPSFPGNRTHALMAQEALLFYGEFDAQLGLDFLRPAGGGERVLTGLVHEGTQEISLDQGFFRVRERVSLDHSTSSANLDFLQALEPHSGEPWSLELLEAYLSLNLGDSAHVNLGVLPLELGLGHVFNPTDPLATAEESRILRGLVFHWYPSADHSFLLWGDTLESWEQEPDDFWRGMGAGLQYQGTWGNWEPRVTATWLVERSLRLGLGSRLGLGPLILRLEAAYDNINNALYPVEVGGLPALPGDWQKRGEAGSFMGLAGLEGAVYADSFTLTLGAEYAYQGRGFTTGEQELYRRLRSQLEADPLVASQPEVAAFLASPWGGAGEQWYSPHYGALYIVFDWDSQWGLEGFFQLSPSDGSSRGSLELRLYPADQWDIYAAFQGTWGAGGTEFRNFPLAWAIRSGLRVRY